MLPQCNPNYKTVHRRFQHWCRNEVLRAAMTDLANALRDEGALDESECFIDASFASARGGSAEIGPTLNGDAFDDFSATLVNGGRVGTDWGVYTGVGFFEVWKVDIVSVSAVPVPAASLLFGSGLLGLIGISRHKKSV